MITVQVRGSSDQPTRADQAIKNLKQLMQHNLVFQMMKRMLCYEPPSVKKARKKQESRRRWRKNMYRKQYED